MTYTKLVTTTAIYSREQLGISRTLLGGAIYCVIVIEMLIPCWLAEPDGPAVEETVT